MAQLARWTPVQGHNMPICLTNKLDEKVFARIQRGFACQIKITAEPSFGHRSQIRMQLCAMQAMAERSG